VLLCIQARFHDRSQTSVTTINTALVIVTAGYYSPQAAADIHSAHCAVYESKITELTVKVAAAVSAATAAGASLSGESRSC
jgi:hypothetical protein